MANLAKAHAWQKANPKASGMAIHQAQNIISPVEKDSTKSTIDEKKVKKRGMRARLEKYLDGLDSVRDFEKGRKLSPRWALEFACDRVLGKAVAPTVNQQNNAPQTSVAVLVKVLCGGESTQISQDTKIQGPTGQVQLYLAHPGISHFLMVVRV